VSKEEIIALLTALDLFASGAYDEDFARFRSYLDAIETELRGTHSACRIVSPSHEESWPLLEIAIDESALDRSAFEVCRRLRHGSPPVYVSHGQLSAGCLVINPHCLTDETSAKLARRLRDELG